MRLIRAADLVKAGEFFRVLETTDRTQVAVMVLRSEAVSGEMGTDHPDSDQLLFVIEGGGSIRVDDEESELQKGDVVIIPAGVPHQVRGPNRTLNFYGPVAYPDDKR